MFKRKIYNTLLDWKQNYSGEKAILIEGARGVGKSTTVEEFVKNEYKSYLLIDFTHISNVIKEAFDMYLEDLDTFFMMLSTYYNVRLYSHESVIIFDEVQQFPKARQAIKRLVQDGRYSYIETGSLVSIKENVKNILIPSGEHIVKMYPMDFEEFCWAMNEGNLITYICKCFYNNKPLDEGLHKKAMLLFREYMLVGGMPKVVDKFVVARDFKVADSEKRNILSLYREDILGAKKSYRNKVLSIFNKVPSFLSRHEKRIRFSDIEKKSSYPLYEDAFFWLEDSMILNDCYNIGDPSMGLFIEGKHTHIKCYMGDTGLLLSLAFSREEIASRDLYKQILFGKMSVNEGMLFENVIAQCLVANDHKLFFYMHYSKKSKHNDIEIDFLLSNGNIIGFKLIPIKVKLGERYRVNSLTKFKYKFKSKVYKSYVIHTKNLSIKGDIIYIPCYMAICL